PVIYTAATKRLMQFARPVRSEHDYRRCIRLDGSAFRDRSLKIGQEFEQERFELVIGTVDLIDQQYRLARRAQGPQQWAFDQEFICIKIGLTRMLAQR